MKTTDFNNGVLHINNTSINLKDLEWNEHPTNKGVFLKHIIKGENTDNQLSCHMVEINPGCEIATHIHEGKTELHEIVDGFGTCSIEDNSINYEKGTMGFIPADKSHSVKAGEEGLILLVKFFPALM